MLHNILFVLKKTILPYFNRTKLFCYSSLRLLFYIRSYLPCSSITHQLIFFSCIHCISRLLPSYFFNIRLLLSIIRNNTFRSNASLWIDLFPELITTIILIINHHNVFGRILPTDFLTNIIRVTHTIVFENLIQGLTSKQRRLRHCRLVKHHHIIIILHHRIFITTNHSLAVIYHHVIHIEANKDVFVTAF